MPGVRIMAITLKLARLRDVASKAGIKLAAVVEDAEGRKIEATASVSAPFVSATPKGVGEALADAEKASVKGKTLVGGEEVSFSYTVAGDEIATAWKAKHKKGAAAEEDKPGQHNRLPAEVNGAK